MNWNPSHQKFPLPSEDQSCVNRLNSTPNVSWRTKRLNEFFDPEQVVMEEFSLATSIWSCLKYWQSFLYRYSCSFLHFLRKSFFSSKKREFQRILATSSKKKKRKKRLTELSLTKHQNLNVSVFVINHLKILTDFQSFFEHYYHENSSSSIIIIINSYAILWTLCFHCSDWVAIEILSSHQRATREVNHLNPVEWPGSVAVQLTPEAREYTQQSKHPLEGKQNTIINFNTTGIG